MIDTTQNDDGTTNYPDEHTDPWGRYPGEPDYGVPPELTDARTTTKTPEPYAPGPTPTLTPSPSPAPSGPSGSSGGGSGGGFTAGSLLAPFDRTWTPPTRGAAWDEAVAKLGNAPRYTAPELPTIDPWRAPTAQDIYSDPSFTFRKDLGEHALLNNRAAQGLTRTGGTLKDLIDYNQNFASQEYGNVANRSLEGWRSNTDATLRRAGMDQDRAKAMYEPTLLEWSKRADVGSRAEENQWDQAYKSFMTDYNIWKDQRDSTFDKLKWQSDFGLDAATR